MKVFAIVGTYRKGGNTEIIIDKALDGAKSEGAQVEKLFVDEVRISTCQGCTDECRKEGICKIDDDLMKVIGKIDEADALIIGTPIYGNYMTGQLKILFDRLMYTINRTEYVQGKRNTVSRLTPKPRNLLTVITAGAPNKDCADDALKLIRRMLSTLTNSGYMKEIIATNVNEKGQILWNIEQLTQTALRLGKPNPEEAASTLKEENDQVLKEAYEIGKSLTGNHQ